MQIAAILIGSVLGITQPDAPGVETISDHDALCLVAFSDLSRSASTDISLTGQMGVMYFVGKLLGHDPGYDVAAGYDMATRAMSEKDENEVTAACAEEMFLEAKLMEDMRNRI